MGAGKGDSAIRSGEGRISAEIIIIFSVLLPSRSPSVEKKRRGNLCIPVPPNLLELCAGTVMPSAAQKVQ